MPLVEFTFNVRNLSYFELNNSYMFFVFFLTQLELSICEKYRKKERKKYIRVLIIINLDF